MSLTVNKSGLIDRIKETAMSGQGFTPAQAIELAELLDANTKSTIKMNDEFHARQTEIELAVFGYDRKGRLNPVISDTEQEQGKEQVADCNTCAANDEKFQDSEVTELLNHLLSPKFVRTNRLFMGLPTSMLIIK